MPSARTNSNGLGQRLPSLRAHNVAKFSLELLRLPMAACNPGVKKRVVTNPKIGEGWSVCCAGALTDVRHGAHDPQEGVGLAGSATTAKERNPALRPNCHSVFDETMRPFLYRALGEFGVKLVRYPRHATQTCRRRSICSAPERSMTKTLTPRSLFIRVGLLSLLLGGGIYLVARPQSLLMFRWFDAIGFNEGVSVLRSVVFGGVVPSITGPIVFSVPLALWVFSYCVFTRAIWHSDSSPWRHVWFWSFPVIALSCEFGQALHFVPGTFDILDFCTVTASLFVAAAFP